MSAPTLPRPYVYRPRAADVSRPVVPCKDARGYQVVPHSQHVWHPTKGITLECEGVR